MGQLCVFAEVYEAGIEWQKLEVEVGAQQASNLFVLDFIWTSFELILVKILSTHGAESLDDGTKSFVKQQLSDFASKLAPSEHIHKGRAF